MAQAPQSQPELRIVHEGRGGYIEIDGTRYAIELVGAGFAIHVQSRHRRGHLELLQGIVDADPAKWVLELRTRRAP